MTVSWPAPPPDGIYYLQTPTQKIPLVLTATQTYDGRYLVVVKLPDTEGRAALVPPQTSKKLDLWIRAPSAWAMEARQAYQLDDYETAERLYQQAAEEAKALQRHGEARRLSFAAVNMAILQKELGRAQDNLPSAEFADGDPFFLMTFDMYRAEIGVEAGRLVDARSSAERALKAARRGGHAWEIYKSGTFLALTYLNSGQPKEACDIFHQIRKMAPPPSEKDLAHWSNSLGWALVFGVDQNFERRADLVEARTYFQDAANVFQESPFELANVLVNQAWLESLDGNWDLARRLAKEAERLDPARRGFAKVFIAWMLGEAAQTADKWAEAEQYFGQALALSQDDPGMTLRVRASLARLREARGQGPMALAEWKLVIAELQKARILAPWRERPALLGWSQKWLSQGIQAFLRAGYKAEALELLDLARAGVSGDLAGLRRLNQLSSAERAQFEGWLGAAKADQAKAARLRRKGAGSNGNQKRNLEAQAALLDRAALQKTQKALDLLPHFSLKPLQKNLAPGQVVYWLGTLDESAQQRRFVAFTVTSQAISGPKVLQPLLSLSTAIGQAAGAALVTMELSAWSGLAAQFLGTLLEIDAHSELLLGQNRDHVFLVPPDNLVGEEWVKKIVHSPTEASVTVLHNLAELEPVTTATGPAAIAADPDGSLLEPALGTAELVQAGISGPKEKVQGDAVTRQWLDDRLRSAGLFFYMGHVYVRPEECGLEASGGFSAQAQAPVCVRLPSVEGLETYFLSDFIAARPTPRLAILSACDSATAKDGLSLTDVFIGSGARTVLGTIRKVDKYEAARFIQVFVEQRGLDSPGQGYRKTVRILAEKQDPAASVFLLFGHP